MSKKLGAQLSRALIITVSREPSDIPVVDFTFHTPKRTERKPVTIRFDWKISFTFFMIDMRELDTGLVRS